MFVERCMRRSRKVSRRLLGHRIEAVEASWSLCKYCLTKSLLEPCWASFISPLEKKTKRDKKLYLKSFGANRLREEILRKLPWFSLLLQAGWPPLMAHLPRESYRLRGLKRSHASKACNNNTQSHWNISKPSLVSKIQIQLQKWVHNKGECVGCQYVSKGLGICVWLDSGRCGISTIVKSCIFCHSEVLPLSVAVGRVGKFWMKPIVPWILWIYRPPRIPVANEDLYGSHTKNLIVKKVIVTGLGG